MPRTNKYWEKEEPREYRVGNVILKHYPKAGALQVFNWVETSSYTGLSKGVTIDVSKLTEQELKQFVTVAAAAAGDEILFRRGKPQTGRVSGVATPSPFRQRTTAGV